MENLISSTILNIVFALPEVENLYKDGLKYQTEGSSGFDLRAFTVTEFTAAEKTIFNLKDANYQFSQYLADVIPTEPENVPFYILQPGKRAMVGTGLFFAIDSAYDIQIRSRSGIALKNGVIVLNSPGTVDSDYRGEICIILANLGSEEFKISLGDRIAQAVITPVVKVTFNIAKNLDSTQRNDGGFGSTGQR